MSNQSRSHQLSNSENDNTIKIPADKLIEALFHAKQCEQHYATQESVDNLKESVNYRFDAVDKRFDDVGKRFDDVGKRFDDPNQNLSNLKNLLIVFFGAIFTAVIGLILKGYIG
ncbi:hypothetical protein ACN08N_26920 (plasmid) [Photobacterium leiognathi subsp. mandapamensis]